MPDLQACHGSSANQFRSQVSGGADVADGGHNPARSCSGVRSVLNEQHRLPFHKAGRAHNERHSDEGSV